MGQSAAKDAPPLKQAAKNAIAIRFFMVTPQLPCILVERPLLTMTHLQHSKEKKASGGAMRVARRGIGLSNRAAGPHDQLIEFMLHENPCECC
jgi:hypothetical protein